MNKDQKIKNEENYNDFINKNLGQNNQENQ